MSKKCDVCGRGVSIVISRSHSMVATKKKKYLNLQTKKIGGKRLKVCTSCLKTMIKKKEKAT
ncbi:MAG: L28 family ribosomal protein [bacterium]